MEEKLYHQLVWQRKMKDEGRCIICGKPAIPHLERCVYCWLNAFAYRHGVKPKKGFYKRVKSIRILQSLVDKEWKRRWENGEI